MKTPPPPRLIKAKTFLWLGGQNAGKKKGHQHESKQVPASGIDERRQAPPMVEEKGKNGK